MQMSSALILACFYAFLLGQLQSADAGLPLDYQSISEPAQIEALVLDLAEDPQKDKSFIDQELQGFGENAVPRLLVLLDKYDNARNGAVVSAIVTLLNKYPIDPFLDKLYALLDRYRDNGSPALWAVAETLGNHPYESSIDPLAKQIERLDIKKVPQEKEREYVEKRDAMLDALIRIYGDKHSNKAFKVLLRLYNEQGGNEGYREIISEADKTKIHLLTEYLKNQRYFLGKDLAMKRLVDIGDPKLVLPVIVERLMRGDESDRNAAIEVLADKADQSMIPDLLKAMETEKVGYIRVNIATVLVKLGRFSCAEYLVHLLKSPYDDSRSWGKDPLVKISGQDYGLNHAAWSRWYKEEKDKRGVAAGDECVRNSWIKQ